MFVLLLVALTWRWGTGAAAQEPLALDRLSGFVELDGRSDEAAWQAIKALPMVMYQPTFRGQMSERTEVRIAYDDQYLYVAGRFYDSQPEGILASSLARDGGTAADDYLNIIIDPFNDNENALWFWANPAGIRGDAALSNDGEGETANNGSWDTFWDLATVQTDEGWFAEVRIPFSSLGFQSAGGQVVMGLAVSRVISRKVERHVFPAMPPDGSLGFAKPSAAQDVLLTGVVSRKPFYVTPYLLGGIDRVAALEQAGTAYAHTRDVTNEIGLDVKYNFTGNLTLDVTANTDFAQVEADDQQVNLTRFSLFFPEKRQFFQERSGLFDYTFGFNERLFHSRQIGLAAGIPVRLLGGARLVGRVGDWDMGALGMQTARAYSLPSENFGVVRLRRRVANDNSYVGLLTTTRLKGEGSYNAVYGLDGLFRVTGDDYLTVKWAQSFDDTVRDDHGFRFAEASFAQVQWQRRRRRGFNYMMWLTRWGADFSPRMGFYTRRDYTQTLTRLAYDWYRADASRLRSTSHDLFVNLYFRNHDGTLETGLWGTSHTVDFKSGWQGYLESVLYHEDLVAALPFAQEAIVPVGGYTFLQSALTINLASGRRFRPSATLSGGPFYDGWNLGLGLKPTWNASRHLEISSEYELNVVRFPERGQGFDAHVVRLRIRGALNRKMSGSAFLQYSNLAAFLGANMRFRYNFRERNDLWIVYNEGLNTSRDLLDPRPPLSNNRTLLLKYTYTFSL